MKIILLIALLPVSFAYAGNVYICEYEFQANLCVYVVEYEYQADLCAYAVDYEYQADDEDALWYFVDYEYQSDIGIHYVNYEYQSDLCVYMVEYEYQSGWKKAASGRADCTDRYRCSHISSMNG